MYIIYIDLDRMFIYYIYGTGNVDILLLPAALAVCVV